MNYSNPVHELSLGDVVRVGNGKVEWEIVGKGATTGLTLKNAVGRLCNAHTFDVTLVRRAA